MQKKAEEAVKKLYGPDDSPGYPVCFFKGGGLPNR